MQVETRNIIPREHTTHVCSYQNCGCYCQHSCHDISTLSLSVVIQRAFQEGSKGSQADKKRVSEVRLEEWPLEAEYDMDIYLSCRNARILRRAYLRSIYAVYDACIYL